MSARALLVLLGSIAVPASADAQAPFGYSEGRQVLTAPGPGLYGESMAFLGDVDGDGRRELAISYGGGPVELLDGRTGAPYAGFYGGEVYACDDLDGDGIEDFGYLTPSPSPPVFTLCSSDGTPLRSFPLPTPYERVLMVATCDDRDGDGIGDLMIATVRSQLLLPSESWVYLYSSGTGQLLLSFDQLCGPHVHPAICHAEFLGDIDGDGIGDFAYSNHGETFQGRSRAGAVYVRSGATGQLIDHSGGWFAEQEYGARVHAIGDLDGDGAAEIAVGPPSTSAMNRSFQVRSPRLQADLFVVGGATGEDRVDGVAAPDIDGDGYPDFLIGRELYSGRDGQLLIRVTPNVTVPSTHFGKRILHVEEVTQEHVFLFADPGATSQQGAICAIAVEPGIRAERRTLRLGSPGPLDLRLRFPASEIGTEYRVLASAAPAGTQLIGGFHLPLLTDAMLRWSANHTLSWLQDGVGTVPAGREVTATVVPHPPALYPLLGTTVRFAVVTRNVAGPRWSSVSVPVTILP